MDPVPDYLEAGYQAGPSNHVRSFARLVQSRSFVRSTLKGSTQVYTYAALIRFSAIGGERRLETFAHLFCDCLIIEYPVHIGVARGFETVSSEGGLTCGVNRRRQSCTGYSMIKQSRMDGVRVVGPGISAFTTPTNRTPPPRSGGASRTRFFFFFFFFFFLTQCF